VIDTTGEIAEKLKELGVSCNAVEFRK